MERWEHMALTVRAEGDYSDRKVTAWLTLASGEERLIDNPSQRFTRAVAVLDELGRDGWQLVQIEETNAHTGISSGITSRTYWVKRRVE